MTDSRDELKVTPQVATPGAESAVYDCLVKAKFHYTDPHGLCIGDPHGPNGVSPQKKSVRVRAGPVGSVSGPCRVRSV